MSLRLFLILIFFGLINYCSAQRLKNTYAEKLRFLTEKSKYYQYRNRDSSNYYLRQADLVYPRCVASIPKIIYLNYKSENLIQKRNFDLADTLLKEALKIGKSLNADTQIKQTQIIQMARTNACFNYYNAINDGLEFEKILIHKNPELDNLKVQLYDNLASSYLAIGDFEKSKYYTNKILENSKNGEDSLKALLRIYFRRIVEQKVDTIILNQALQLARKTKMKEKEMHLMINTSDYFIYHGNPNLAIRLIKKMISKIDIVWSYWLPYCYINLAEAYLIKNEYRQSMFYLNKAELCLNNEEYWHLKQDFYHVKSKLCEKMEDYKQAYLFNNLYWDARIAKNILLQKQNVAELDARYQLAEKRVLIADNATKSSIQQERINVKQKQNNWLVIILVIMGTFFSYIAWNYKKKQVISYKLNKKSNSLEESNQLKSKLFGILSHDLKEPLNELKVLLQLFQGKNINETELMVLSKKLEQKMFSVQSMLENLLSWSVEQLKGQKSDLGRINLTVLIDRVLDNLSNQYLKKDIKISKLNKDMQFMANEVQMEIVLRNLLTNAIKFTPNGGFIQIEVKQIKNEVIIFIEDNGIGIPNEKINEIFNFPKSSLGTDGEVGTGLGLRICKELLEKNNGDLTLTNLNPGVLAKIVFH